MIRNGVEKTMSAAIITNPAKSASKPPTSTTTRDSILKKRSSRTLFQDVSVVKPSANEQRHKL